MKVTIDEESCVNCEACIEICPKVFEIKDDKVKVKLDNISKEVGKSCQEAAENCPVEAIRIGS